MRKKASRPSSKKENRHLSESEGGLLVTPKRFEKGLIFRLLSAILLGAAALGLFLLNNRESGSLHESDASGTSAVLRAIDPEIDSVLTQFGVRQEWIRKKRISSENVIRYERRVSIPRTVVPALLNRAMNALARRFDGRAVATENLKQNTVTIHVEIGKVIVETVVLKIDPNLKTGGKEAWTGRGSGKLLSAL